jgi:hypothetical protein
MMLVVRHFIKASVLNILSWLLYVIVLLGLYFGFFRNLQMTWGATSEDVERPMMGDELLINPEFNATRAIEIHASPEEIWPWIIQMGKTRAGFYGFDNLDNGGVPSADTILSEYQDLQVGDSIPGGVYKGKVWNLLEVREMDPGKEVLWVFLRGTPWEGATWSWGLYRIDDERTRLVSRLRQKYNLNSIQQVVSCSIIDAIEILMMRTTLRGIRYRVERNNETGH